MARRFAYVSFGILCLVAAYQLGAREARADWERSGTGVVVGGSHGTYYGSSGEAWKMKSLSPQWERASDWDLPIPAADVKFVSQSGWNGGIMYVVTVGDAGWVKHGATYDWEYVGPFPGGPVGRDRESWGSVKEKYR